MIIPGVDIDEDDLIFINRNNIIPSFTSTATIDRQRSTDYRPIRTGKGTPFGFNPNPYYSIVAGIMGLFTKGPWFAAGNATINLGSTPAGSGRGEGEPIWTNDRGTGLNPDGTMTFEYQRWLDTQYLPWEQSYYNDSSGGGSF
jgi:hypothetical protein